MARVRWLPDRRRPVDRALEFVGPNEREGSTLAGTFVPIAYGRRMYELMADYWPTAEADPAATPAMVEFARIWRDKPKIVFSRTLEQVAWNSRLVHDDAVAEVARLKTEPGDMDVGGPTIAAPLLRHGLIDEVRLFVQPVILGAGTPFFPALDDRIELKLLETRTFGSGVVSLRYSTRTAG